MKFLNQSQPHVLINSTINLIIAQHTAHAKIILVQFTFLWMRQAVDLRHMYSIPSVHGIHW